MFQQRRRLMDGNMVINPKQENGRTSRSSDKCLLEQQAGRICILACQSPFLLQSRLDC
jgi:hypothetical protein